MGNGEGLTPAGCFGSRGRRDFMLMYRPVLGLTSTK